MGRVILSCFRFVDHFILTEAGTIRYTKGIPANNRIHVAQLTPGETGESEGVMNYIGNLDWGACENCTHSDPNEGGCDVPLWRLNNELTIEEGAKVLAGDFVACGYFESRKEADDGLKQVEGRLADLDRLRAENAQLKEYTETLKDGKRHLEHWLASAETERDRLKEAVSGILIFINSDREYIFGEAPETTLGRVTDELRAVIKRQNGG